MFTELTIEELKNLLSYTEHLCETTADPDWKQAYDYEVMELQAEIKRRNK